MWFDHLWKNTFTSTFMSTVNKQDSQRTRFRDVYTFPLASPCAILNFHFYPTGFWYHKVYYCSHTEQPKPRIHPPKCRGKEILRESSIITEGSRLRVQGHDLVISGLLHPLRFCWPNSVQSVAGHGEHEWQIRIPSWIHRGCWGNESRWLSAGHCKGNARETADSRVATKCGSPRARRRWQLGRESIQGHSAEEEEGGE